MPANREGCGGRDTVRRGHRATPCGFARNRIARGMFGRHEQEKTHRGHRALLPARFLPGLAIITGKRARVRQVVEVIGKERRTAKEAGARFSISRLCPDPLALPPRARRRRALEGRSPLSESARIARRQTAPNRGHAPVLGRRLGATSPERTDASGECAEDIGAPRAPGAATEEERARDAARGQSRGDRTWQWLAP